MKTENKGKKHFVGGSPAGQGLPERAGLLKKGYRQEAASQAASCKDNTDSKIFWSSSEYNGNNACNVNFNSNGNLNLNNNNKNNSNNKVRCVFASLIEPNNNKQ